MKYIYYFKIKIINFIINTLQPVIFPIVYPSRHTARIYVYSYIITNNIYMKGLLVTNHNVVPTVKWKYLLYYWLVWVWLDDSAGNDIIDIVKFKDIAISANTPKFISKLIIKSDVINNTYKHSYHQLGHRSTYAGKLPLHIFIMQLFISNNNNYYLLNSHTINSDLIFSNKYFGWRMVYSTVGDTVYSCEKKDTK